MKEKKTYSENFIRCEDQSICKDFENYSNAKDYIEEYQDQNDEYFQVNCRRTSM